MANRQFTRLAVAGFLIALGSCGGSSTDATTTVQPDDPGATHSKDSASALIALYDGWTAAYKAGDWDKVASFFADDATFQTGNNPQKLVGGAAIAKTLQMVTVGFPDMESHTLAVLAKNGWLADVVLSRGTNSGALMGQPATNKRTSFVAMQIWRVNKDGKIQSVVAHADNLNFLGHLGMFPGEARPVDETAPAAKVQVVGAPANPANEAIVKGLVTGIDAHDAEAITALYDGEAVLDDVSALGEAAKTQAIRGYWQALFAMFPDVKYTGVEIQSVGDHVVMSYDFEGTNSGDMPRFGAKATGKPLKMVAADVFKIVDGKIVRHDIFVDGMSVGIMLGLMKF